MKIVETVKIDKTTNIKIEKNCQNVSKTPKIAKATQKLLNQQKIDKDVSIVKTVKNFWNSPNCQNIHDLSNETAKMIKIVQN